MDNNREGGEQLSYLFFELSRFYTATSPSEMEAQLAAIEACVQAGDYAVGYFSYELSYVLHPRLRERLPAERTVPLFCVGIYRQRLVVRDKVLEAALASFVQHDDAYILNCQLNMPKAQYLERLRRVQEHLYQGDTYQVNYTLKYKFTHGGSPLKLYAELRQRQRVAYGAFLDFPGLTVLSRSPELFVQKTGEDLCTKPMKGTSERGKTPELDARNAAFLLQDEKSRAEHVMIVDLLRNDFSRLSQRGTVKTTGLFEVQTYETVHQMVSTVTARVAKNLSLISLLRGVFPSGSITGAPKVRTMELIRDLETEPRGVYTGALGYVGPDGSLGLNVPIRTLALWPDGQGEMGVGSGIVSDSDPEAEYAECRLKGQFFTRGFTEFSLLESLLFDNGYGQLAKHLVRLGKSAATLGFSVDLPQLQRDLLRQAAALSAPTKVRVVLAKSGHYTIESLVLDSLGNEEKKVMVAPQPIRPAQHVLPQHKTSRRAFYQAMYATYRRHGYYDVLFVNEQGEITEGTFNNVFIRVGAAWYTPPVACGVLPGIQRQCLLESSDIEATEKVLSVEDLHQADAIYLTNAVRGVVQVTLDPPWKEPLWCV
ncbi:aminodeoxychorismate synthase component I [Hymenobacter sp. RP-2-7]|uniref:Aminodeoxychorismate synthase component I n=1 Tax=Hymenobacter polaris TaxID=2682546 RepID=A0A7Y0AD71_9BACT|nr:aminodeoxychorismate synthase component I [Hymenobacter polaris]NML65169.1 aminodeoxychorismate synthase component I [Hymenobacter polaris]